MLDKEWGGSSSSLSSETTVVVCRLSATGNEDNRLRSTAGSSLLLALMSRMSDLRRGWDADQFIDMLSNTDNVNHRVIIIKLVSNNDIWSCIEEVMSSVPIESQASFNKLPIKWEDCVRPYAVDEHAYMNHTRGRNEGIPRDPNPSVQTVGERVATYRAKIKVVKPIKNVCTLEQQRLILL